MDTAIAFLIDKVGVFWAWVIVIFVVYWVVAIAFAIVIAVYRWSVEKLFQGVGFSVGFIIALPFVLLDWIFGRRKRKQDFAKSEAGKNYELRVGKLYEKRGYEVEYRGIELGLKDGGIDLIAKKPNETVLIQCKYWKNRKIDHLVVRSFFGDCFAYINKRSIPYDEVRCILAIPSRDTLEYGAKQYFIENTPKMRYEVVDARG